MFLFHVLDNESSEKSLSLRPSRLKLTRLTRLCKKCTCVSPVWLFMTAKMDGLEVLLVVVALCGIVVVLRSDVAAVVTLAPTVVVPLGSEMTCLSGSGCTPRGSAAKGCARG